MGVCLDVYTHKRVHTCFDTHTCTHTCGCIHERALYLRKRALFDTCGIGTRNAVVTLGVNAIRYICIFRKRALYLRKRAVYLRKRAVYLRKRALYLRKRVCMTHVILECFHHTWRVCLSVHMYIPQKSHTNPEKSPTYPQKSPISPQKSLYDTCDVGMLSSHLECMPLDTYVNSAKEPYKSRKEPYISAVVTHKVDI